MNTIVNIFSDEIFCLLFKWLVVAITGHYVRTKLYLTQPDIQYTFFFRRMLPYSSYKKIEPNSSYLSPIDYAIGSALQEKVYLRQTFTTAEQLKLSTIDVLTLSGPHCMYMCMYVRKASVLLMPREALYKYLCIIQYNAYICKFCTYACMYMCVHLCLHVSIFHVYF